MSLFRIGRPVIQINIARSCRLSSAPGFTLRRGIQYSTVGSGTGQRVWRVSYTKCLFAGTISSVGLGISAFARSKVLCEAPSFNGVTQGEEPYRVINSNEYPSPPQSSLSLFELSFGAVTGICAGVFVKKGARAMAWFLGGIFVFLQYLGSQSLVRVDWARMSSRFESLFYTRDAAGKAKPPSVSSLGRWLIDFLTADFQPRASFLAGFALGLRVG